jgi:hypothetical protein
MPQHVDPFQTALLNLHFFKVKLDAMQVPDCPSIPPTFPKQVLAQHGLTVPASACRLSVGSVGEDVSPFDSKATLVRGAFVRTLMFI